MDVPVKSSQIGAVFPDLITKYGKNANIDIGLKTVDPDPHLQILNGETTLNLSASLPFYNTDKDPEELIMQLESIVTARISFGVKEGPKDTLLLTGSLGDLTITI